MRLCGAGQCLHSTASGLNPYKSVISILCKTLAAFDDDHLIPTFGFGDFHSRDHSLVHFSPDGAPVHTMENVLAAYDTAINTLTFSGPTSFAPAIYKAVEIVRASRGQYHILIIIADGQVGAPALSCEAVSSADGRRPAVRSGFVVHCTTGQVATLFAIAGLRRSLFAEHHRSNCRGEPLSTEHCHGRRWRRPLRRVRSLHLLVLVRAPLDPNSDCGALDPSCASPAGIAEEAWLADSSWGLQDATF